MMAERHRRTKPPRLRCDSTGRICTEKSPAMRASPSNEIMATQHGSSSVPAAQHVWEVPIAIKDKHQLPAISTYTSDTIVIMNTQPYKQIIKRSQRSDGKSLATFKVHGTKNELADMLATRSALLFKQIIQLSQQLASQRMEQDLVQLIQDLATPEFLDHDRDDVAVALVSMRGAKRSRELTDEQEAASAPTKKKWLRRMHDDESLSSLSHSPKN